VCHVFQHVVIKIQQLFLRTATCLTSTPNAARTNSLTCLPKYGGARCKNVGHPSDDWPLRTLLSFRNRTPSALTAIPSRANLILSFPTLISLSGVVQHVFHYVVIKNRQLFLRTTCLTSTFLETGMGANDCKCSQDQQLKMPSEAQRSSKEVINFGHPSDEVS
jgi:hypothetical protein